MPYTSFFISRSTAIVNPIFIILNVLAHLKILRYNIFVYATVPRLPHHIQNIKWQKRRTKINSGSAFFLFGTAQIYTQIVRSAAVITGCRPTA